MFRTICLLVALVVTAGCGMLASLVQTTMPSDDAGSIILMGCILCWPALLILLFLTITKNPRRRAAYGRRYTAMLQPR